MKSRSLLDLVRRSGFAGVDSLIHLFVGGSELHGAKVGETDDTDLYGVILNCLSRRWGSMAANISYGPQPATIAATARMTWM